MATARRKPQQVTNVSGYRFVLGALDLAPGETGPVPKTAPTEKIDRAVKLGVLVRGTD